MNKPPRGNPMAAEPAITPDVVAEHGLSAEEYERIQKIMGRAPMVKTSRMIPPTPVAAP